MSNDEVVRVCCEDCGLEYNEDWLDIILSTEQRVLISGNTDGSGILCVSCIIKRAAKYKTFTVGKLVFE